MRYLTDSPPSCILVSMKEDDMTEQCPICGRDLEPTEFDLCAACTDEQDLADDFEEYMQNRFDMETEWEYRVRKENRW